MKTKFVFCLFILVIVSACDNGGFQKLLPGSWTLSDFYKYNEAEKGANDLLDDPNLESSLRKGLIFSFFTDSSFTRIMADGTYSFGRWSIIEKNKLILSFNSGTTESYEIFMKMIKKKAQLSMIDKSGNLEMKLTDSGLPLKNQTEDPYHPLNNTWRIRSGKPESVKEIHEKLANHFKHLAYICKASKERESDIVTFTFSQGLVKIYSSGIGIHKVQHVPLEWRTTFYNDSIAMNAYLIFKQYLKDDRYKGNSTGDWVQDDYNILMSIYEDVKKGKFPGIEELAKK
jgi:hypothetical protein